MLTQNVRRYSAVMKGTKRMSRSKAPQWKSRGELGDLDMTDNEGRRMKRLGTAEMEGQMLCPVGRRWFLGEDENMTKDAQKWSVRMS